MITTGYKFDFVQKLLNTDVVTQSLLKPTLKSQPIITRDFTIFENTMSYDIQFFFETKLILLASSHSKDI